MPFQPSEVKWLLDFKLHETYGFLLLINLQPLANSNGPALICHSGWMRFLTRVVFYAISIKPGARNETHQADHVSLREPRSDFISEPLDHNDPGSTRTREVV